MPNNRHLTNSIRNAAWSQFTEWSIWALVREDPLPGPWQQVWARSFFELRIRRLLSGGVSTERSLIFNVYRSQVGSWERYEPTLVVARSLLFAFSQRTSTKSTLDLSIFIDPDSLILADLLSYFSKLTMLMQAEF